MYYIGYDLFFENLLLVLAVLTSVSNIQLAMLLRMAPGADAVVWWGKAPPATLATPMGLCSGCSMSNPALCRRLEKSNGKWAKCIGPRHPREPRKQPLAPAFGTAQLWPTQPCGEWTSRWKTCLSCFINLSNKYINWEINLFPKTKCFLNSSPGDH